MKKIIYDGYIVYMYSMCIYMFGNKRRKNIVACKIKT